MLMHYHNFYQQCLIVKVVFLQKGGVRVTQNIAKKGPTLITFDIKHKNEANSNRVLLIPKGTKPTFCFSICSLLSEFLAVYL